MLESLGIDLTPSMLIANKEVIRDKDKPRYTKKIFPFEITNTWMTHMTKKTVQDFQQSVLQVSLSQIHFLKDNFKFITYHHRYLNHLMMKELLLAFQWYIMNSQQAITRILVQRDSS